MKTAEKNTYCEYDAVDAFTEMPVFHSLSLKERQKKN